MSQESNHDNSFDDEKLRCEIRAEIEQREQDMLKARQQKQIPQESVNAERKRKLYQEELRKFYKERPGYREIVSEDGEVDWVPFDESDKVLCDDVLEDPVEAKRRQKLFISITTLLVIVASIIIFLLLHQGEGKIQVVCNVPETQVILDAATAPHFAGEIIEQVSAGEHVITVAKEGYHIVSQPVVKINLGSGELKVINFMLEPDLGSRQDIVTPDLGRAKP